MLKSKSDAEHSCRCLWPLPSLVQHSEGSLVVEVTCSCKLLLFGVLRVAWSVSWCVAGRCQWSASFLLWCDDFVRTGQSVIWAKTTWSAILQSKDDRWSTWAVSSHQPTKWSPQLQSIQQVLPECVALLIAPCLFSRVTSRAITSFLSGLNWLDVFYFC